AERFIRRTWEPHLAEQRKAPHHPKSALQELAAAKGRKMPVYEVVARTGAHHAPRFTVRVSVPRLGEATAEGTSKQEAETAAADGLSRVDRRSGGRSHPARDRFRRGADARGREANRLAHRASAAAVSRAQQDRPGEEGEAAWAIRGPDGTPQSREGVHDQRRP